MTRTKDLVEDIDTIEAVLSTIKSNKVLEINLVGHKYYNKSNLFKLRPLLRNEELIILQNTIMELLEERQTVCKKQLIDELQGEWNDD